jgi:hypothetical protein
MDVLKYTRADLASLIYHPIRPLDVVSEEIGIPCDEVSPSSTSTSALPPFF